MCANQILKRARARARVCVCVCVCGICYLLFVCQVYHDKEKETHTRERRKTEIKTHTNHTHLLPHTSCLSTLVSHRWLSSLTLTYTSHPSKSPSSRIYLALSVPLVLFVVWPCVSMPLCPCHAVMRCASVSCAAPLSFPAATLTLWVPVSLNLSRCLVTLCLIATLTPTMSLCMNKFISLSLCLSVSYLPYLCVSLYLSWLPLSLVSLYLVSDLSLTF